MKIDSARARRSAGTRSPMSELAAGAQLRLADADAQPENHQHRKARCETGSERQDAPEGDAGGEDGLPPGAIRQSAERKADDRIQ